MQELINRAKELLADGTVARVLGWKAGDLPYNPEPAYFEKEEDFADFVYNGFCGANLSKYMIEASKLEGKTLVCLKPCDTYSFQELMKEHRVDREKAYIIGVGCKGKLDIEKIKAMGIKGIKINPVVIRLDTDSNLLLAKQTADITIENIREEQQYRKDRNKELRRMRYRQQEGAEQAESESAAE